MSKEKLTTKRFVIRKSLIGKNVVITFTNKKGKKCTYNHDEVYYDNQERFDIWNVFKSIKVILLLTTCQLGQDSSNSDNSLLLSP